MKLLIVIFFAICFAVSPNSFAQVAQSQPNKLAYFPVDSLLGKWVSYSTEWEERKVVSKTKVTETFMQSRCNVCPEINFKADSTATVRPEGSNEKVELNFLWSIQGNSLVVRQLAIEKSSRSTSAFLSAGRYRIGYRISKAPNSHREVVLTSKNGGRYILTRSSE